MSELQFEQIKSFLESQKDSEEVKGFLNGFVPKPEITVDSLESLITEKEDFKRWFDSKKDSHFSKGLETWKTNNLNKLIDEEVGKRFPEKTEEQKRIAELEQEIERTKREALVSTLRTKARDIASSKKLPLDLVDYFIGEDEEGTNNNLQTLEKLWTESLTNAVNEKFKENGRDINNGSVGSEMTREKFLKLPYNQRISLLNENPEYQKFLK